MKTLEYRINNFVMDRTEDAGGIAIQNVEYKELGKKISIIMHEIGQYLPGDKKYLIGDLEVYNNSQADIMEIEIYKQGFKDGFKLNSFLEI